MVLKCFAKSYNKINFFSCTKLYSITIREKKNFDPANFALLRLYNDRSFIKIKFLLKER